MSTNHYVISYQALRKLIGLLGMALPFLCWGVNSLVNHLDLLNNPLFVDVDKALPYEAADNLKSSVSHFYYTASGPLFTGILITVAIFLLCYKGNPIKPNDDKYAWLSDNRLASFAGVCALGIVVFPIGSDDKITDNIHIFVASAFAATVHLSFAALFFVSIAIMCIVNFRRHPNKVFVHTQEGNLYLVCGWGILICLLVLAIYSFTPWHSQAWVPYSFVYIVEAMMLILFGIAWLVKGKSYPTELVLKKL
jgi:ABC-type amino acid transport system permease subunit